MTAQQILYRKYGSPDEDYQKTFCEIWHVKQDFPWFPAEKFLVNKDFKIVLVKAFKALESKGINSEIKTFDGCYEDRDSRGTNAKSLHAWACAIDLNAATNGMRVDPTPEERNGNWSKDFILTMIGAGLFYGGDFSRRADPMHWAYYNG